ncbi:dihydrolipoyl dehydrogenase [Roseomonas sp. CAU 1739]|uniref:dihydrolipoyl dehydrogenase n=1 Tax=Roseomonas sp. CAU 1739 TaxID=3140364 RepID=UPI00325AFCD6
MGDMTAKLLVVGGGPGGYTAAIRAGQLGCDTVLVERSRLGGTCLNIGCIPSKALIHVADTFGHAMEHARASPFGLEVGRPTLDFARAVEWKDGIVSRLNAGVAALLKKNRIRTVHGPATMLDGKTCRVETDIGPQTIRAEHVLLATGSEPVELPFLPFGGRVISSTEALSLPQVPARLVVVGAGYIGLELGMAFGTLGAEVTVVEAADRVLPRYDTELTRPVVRRMEALGITVLTDAEARGLAADGEALLVRAADGAERTILSDAILVAVGRRPCTQSFGLERLDLAMNGPFIHIDERCATSMRNVWAVGDVTGEPMLAHRAMAQGEMVAEIIAGERRVFDKVAIPDICFTTPEIVTVGISPAEAHQAGWEIRLGHFPFSANGRAMTKNAEDGFVRVVARADNNLVLGLQAVGHGVSELAAAFGLALEMGARLEDIAGTIYAHPTQGEAIQEAARKALGHALHM